VAGGVSERRACEVLGQSRSCQRYKLREAEEEPRLISRILEWVSQSPRYGYRQITRLLRIEGWHVNAKRIYRLWRREGLKAPKKKAKRASQGSAIHQCWHEFLHIKARNLCLQICCHGSRLLSLGQCRGRNRIHPQCRVQLQRRS
jgi:transposase InsO family protein